MLRVISSSPGDLQPVFNTMLENALRICEAKFGVLFRIDDEVTYPVAMLNLPLLLTNTFGNGSAASLGQAQTSICCADRGK